MDDHSTTWYSMMYPFACLTCAFDAPTTQAKVWKVGFATLGLLMLEHKDAKEWTQMIAVLCEPYQLLMANILMGAMYLLVQFCRVLSCKCCHCLGNFLTSNPLQRSFIRLITCRIGVRRTQTGDVVDKSESKLEQTDGQGIGFFTWIMIRKNRTMF